MVANPDRYDIGAYRRPNTSGLYLPAVALGLWHNFGTNGNFEEMKKMCFAAFNNGITHFDLANNYGPEPGSAEENFGKIINNDLKAYRDEIIVSTKAGYHMWNGPYGDGGTRKYLTASLNQSLSRLKLDYVDIFYHHRPDNDTPLEETMYALSDIVKSGKALYVGLSNYNTADTKRAIAIMKTLKCPLYINQVRYSMLDRHIEEDGLLDFALDNIGIAIFSPLEQGLLTDRYFNGIPENSRASLKNFLKPERITPDLVGMVKQLNEVAASRGQTMAQMALSWALKHDAVTTVIIGASSESQVTENLCAAKNTFFEKSELDKIDSIIYKK